MRTGRLRGLPVWAKVGAGVLVVLLGIGVALVVTDDDPGTSAVTPAGEAPSSTSAGTGGATTAPGGTAQPPATDRESPDSTVIDIPTTTTIAVPDGTWTEVGSLTGTGNQRGEPFSLGGYVRVSYRSAGGPLEVFLVGPGGPGPPVATCSDACDQQAVVQKDRADYFIEVKNPGEWTVIVEELKR
jgi:hypothetical protein